MLRHTFQARLAPVHFRTSRVIAVVDACTAMGDAIVPDPSLGRDQGATGADTKPGVMPGW